MVLRTFGRKVVKHTGKKIFLYNTLGREKAEFIPIVPQKVRMYNCGPTVYNIQHIGNLRAFVLANLLRRMFEYNGYQVKQIMNLTDVGHLTDDADSGEDKMEKQAKEEGKTTAAIAKHVTKVFFKDLEALNAKPKDLSFPKASEHIAEQIAFIKTLEEKGFTYKTSDGIYFDTSKFRSYGEMAKLHIEGLKEGARVEANKEKLHSTDFALWKFSPENEKRQQEWESPWGVGFPGWHIECSAMAMKYLGKRIDVHTGGVDHIPIHHTNEIAQSETATGQKYVNFWIHNEHLTLEGKKIAKSTGHCVYLHNLTDRGIPALAFRYWLLTAKYNTKVNFTWDAIEAAQSGYFKLLRFFVEKLGKKTGAVILKYQQRFHEYVNDDLDTPKIIALMHDMMKDTESSKADLRATFLDFDQVLGLGFAEANTKLIENLAGEKKLKVSDIPDEIQSLLKEREYARSEKNFERADAIRVELAEKGYEIIDSSEGATVKKKA
jgi:cysteinyl-tRNA synthetase